MKDFVEEILFLQIFKCTFVKETVTLDIGLLAENKQKKLVTPLVFKMSRLKQNLTRSFYVGYKGSKIISCRVFCFEEK